MRCASASPPSPSAGRRATGDMPHWHQVGDTFDKMNPEVLERAYAFTWAFISALDARAGA